MPLSLLQRASLAAAALAFMLPAAHAQSTRAKGAPITAAIVSNYPPMEFKDPATAKLTGFDVDLGEALAAKLGTTIKWEETSFDQMLSSLATGRVDIILSGMTDLPARRDAVSFIDYLKTGPQFYVAKERAAEYPSMAALCGKKVGASRRTSFPTEIAAWSDANCVKAGKPPIAVTGTDGSADARTQLRQGRLDAAVQGGETLPYLMGQEPNTYSPVGKAFVFQYVGLAVTRKNDALRRRDQRRDDQAHRRRALREDRCASGALQNYALPKLLIDSAN